jgi:ribosomal protein S12 methylthiotransferase
MAKIGIVSLGCAKNLINTEQMMWLLDEAGYEVTDAVEHVDAVLVNTCAFIESAKSEAIETILELAALKAEGKVGRIVVAGCLAERYRGDVLTELPEVDGLVGCGAFDDIVEAVDQALLGGKPALHRALDGAVSETPRMLTTPPFWAYLKLSEGCDNRCAYCAIPAIRGPYRERPRESVVEEAKALAAGGAKELILVAQDLTRYRDLPGLLTQLCAIEGIQWIRLHYLYPDDITDELIEVVAREEKIVKYLDIPIQHAEDGVLARMNRRGTGASYRALFAKLRERIPGLVLRTTVMVGFPGETWDAFDTLCDFIRDIGFERVGAFSFSAEEGTPAAALPDPVDAETAAARLRIAEELRHEILDEYNRGQVGKTLEVLCEGFDRHAECFFGRTYADSPEIDGKLFILYDAESPGTKPTIGDMVRVTVTDSIDGDLEGVMA